MTKAAASPPQSGAARPDEPSCGTLFRAFAFQDGRRAQGLNAATAFPLRMQIRAFKFSARHSTPRRLKNKRRIFAERTIDESFYDQPQRTERRFMPGMMFRLERVQVDLAEFERTEPEFPEYVVNSWMNKFDVDGNSYALIIDECKIEKWMIEDSLKVISDYR